VVAVGDLHGDLNKARRAFRLGGLIDEQDRWAGGTTTAVQARARCAPERVGRARALPASSARLGAVRRRGGCRAPLLWLRVQKKCLLTPVPH